MKRMKKMLSFLLVLSMVVQFVPLFAVATEEGTCPHHAHDNNCGYVEAVVGQPCTHQHDETCLKDVTSCVHTHSEAEGCIYTPAAEAVACDHQHDESCNYVAAQPAVPCTCNAQPQHAAECASLAEEPGECNCSPTLTHAEGCNPRDAVAESCSHVHGECAYKAAVPESWSCNHVCSKDSGCVKAVCAHAHDGNCGYVEAVEGKACTFVCQECNKLATPTFTAPAAKSGLVYIIAEQELITPGSATGGVMEYKMGDSGWSTAIPTGANAGTYTVWYRVVGNEGYEDIPPASLTVTIAKQSPGTLEDPIPKWNIYYGQRLAEALLWHNWQWVDGTVMPSGIGTGSYPVYRIIDDQNYDYSGVAGYNPNTHRVESTCLVTVLKTTPAITVQASPTSASAGTTVTVTVSVKNPYNESLTNLPNYTCVCKDNLGNDVPLSNGSFVIPNAGDSFTITVTTPESDLYASATASTTVSVTDCTHNNKTLEHDSASHWYACGECGAKLDMAFHSGGTGTCTEQAVCTTCSEPYGGRDINNHNSTKTATCVTSVFCSDCRIYFKDPSNHEKPNEFRYAVNTENPTGHNKLYACCGAKAGFEAHTPKEGSYVRNPGDSSKHLYTCALCGGTVAEIHQHTYSADGATITESCSKCLATLGEITLSAPSKHYDGNPVTATVSSSSPSEEPPVVEYYKGGEKLTAAPSEVGDYTAKITLNGVTASKSFSITIPEAIFDGIAYEYNGKIWYQEAKLRAPYGYTISTLADGAFGGDISFPDGIHTSYTYYLKPESSSAAAVQLVHQKRVQVDGTKPVINSATVKEISTTTATIELDVTETGSGFYYMRIKPLDDSVECTMEGTVCHFTNLKPGTAYTFSFCAIDEASNFSEWMNGVSFTTMSVTAPTPKTGLVYKGAAQELVTAGVVTGGTILYSLEENGTYSEDIPTGIHAGDYTVWYYVDGSGFYQDSPKASIPVSIGTIPLTLVSATVEDKTYDGTNSAVVKEVTFSGLQGTEVLTMGTDYTVTAKFDNANAGENKTVTVTVKLMNTQKAKNYSLPSNTLFATADIVAKEITTPIPVTLSFDKATYNGKAHQPTVTLGTGAEAIPADQYTVAYKNNVNAGTATVTVTAKDGGNYRFTPQEKTFTIAPAKLTVTADNKWAYVDEDMPRLSYTVTGLVDKDKLVKEPVLYVNPDMSRPGTYTIRISDAVATKNYTVTHVPGTLTVRMRPEVTVPISGQENTVHVKATVKNHTATIQKFDINVLDHVVADRVEEHDAVTVDFSELKQKIETVQIPTGIIAHIAEAAEAMKQDNGPLEILLTEDISVEIDAVSLYQKIKQTKYEDLSITILSKNRIKNLTREQKAAIGKESAYQVTVLFGEKHIAEIEGDVTVSVAYDLKKDEKPENLKVYAVDEAGKLTLCESAFDSETGRICWKTGKNSLYVITCE